MKSIVILGAGGFAREVAWLIEEINKEEPTWEILGFSAVDKTHLGESIGKYHIRFSDEKVAGLDVSIAVGFGNPTLLSKAMSNFQGVPMTRFPNLIHPSVEFDHDGVRLGAGNLICAGTVLTTGITIGSFNIINLNCTVGHDCVIGDACVANPGCNISGNTRIGKGCLLGTGSTVLQGIRIGATATVGAGAVVTKDVPPGVTVVGVPARPISSRSE
ncbi:MAG: acetyltransferase [Thermoanaerobaculales bacterium]|nr:acetyltransferase [Thermoanaerobaculales bacterium]